MEGLDDKIKAKQDHLLDLKRKIEARQQLLSKLREIGEKSKPDTVEYYFQQLNKNSDELALKDKQIQIHQDKIKDLEKLLSMARSQAAEANRLTLQVNSLEEEVSLMREGREGELRGMDQEREKWEFERKGLREDLENATDKNKKLEADLQDCQKQRAEAEKTRDQLHAKLEDTVKQKEKISGETKNEADKVDKLKEEVEMLKLLIDAEKKKTKEASSTVDKLNKEKKTVESERKSVEDSYTKLKKEMEKMMEQDRLQRGLLENEIKDMRKTVHEQREKINKLDSELLERQRKMDEQVSDSEIERLRQDNNTLLDELRKNMEELLKMEELELLVPQLKERELMISRLENQVEDLKGRLGDKNRELEGEDQHIQSLRAGLTKAELSQNKLNQQIEANLKEKKDLLDRLKKKDVQIEEKDQEIKQSLDALESVKAAGKKLRVQIEKGAKERDDLARRLDKVLGDFSSMKRSKEEIQAVLDRLQSEFMGYKESLGKKDEWILKQGDEMKIIAEQYASLKKKHLEYKLEVDLEFGKALAEKNTEILVLREMVKSTKSMVRAKDVDLSRFKRKVYASENNMLMQNASDDDRAGLTTAKSSLSRAKPGIVARSAAGALRGPNNLRSMAKLSPSRIPEHDSLDEDAEKPVYKLVRSIDEKKQITVKKSPADIRRLMDEEDKQRAEGRDHRGLRLNKLVPA